MLNITKAFEASTGWLSYDHLPTDCEDRRVANSLRECFAAACRIYLRRATTDDNLESSVEHLISLISKIDPDSHGAHALPWVCFIGGAESVKPDHRALFVNRMHEIYARTKFRNLPAAVESLEEIWARKDPNRWTLCLPILSKTLVM